MFGRLFGAKTPILDSLPEVRGKYIENAKLAKHTWFGVGGPAEVLFLPEDADDLKKYFTAQAKGLLDKGVKIEQVNGNKTLFSVSPADGSYKVNFGEEEFMNYFKEFLRPQLVEMLF